MARNRPARRARAFAGLSALIALPALALVAAACGSGAEQQILQKYFSASRLRDQATLGNIATVSFDPAEDGSVQTFDVTNVGPEQVKQLRVRELRKAYDDARAADDEFSKRKKKYQADNVEAIDRVIKAERSNARVSGRDAEIRTAWAKWLEEMAQHAKLVNDTRKALSDERSIAELSVFDARRPIDISEYDGELVSKDVTVNARVSKEGQASEKALVVTMQRARLKKDDQELNGRWVVTDIREASAPAPTS
jgi:hypothetical protein